MVASLVVLACLAGARADLVLCMGADGHVEIEQAVHGVCTDPGAAPVEPGSGVIAAGHCGPCVDVALEFAPAVRTGDTRIPSDGISVPFAMLQAAPVLSAGASVPAQVFLRPSVSAPGARILRI